MKVTALAESSKVSHLGPQPPGVKIKAACFCCGRDSVPGIGFITATCPVAVRRSAYLTEPAMNSDTNKPSHSGQIERNPDGTLTKETIKRMMKAFRRRLKLTRLDDESRLGHDPLSKGERSSVTGVQPPEQYPQEIWDELVELGRMRRLQPGLYEVVEL